MNQNEKSEAQLRNEEAVRKIMAERGYDRASIKKKKRNKKPLILSSTLILLSVIIVAVIFVVINKKDDHENNNNVNATYSIEETNKGNDETNSQTSSEEPEDTTMTNDGTDNQYTPSANGGYEDYNVYYSHTDSDGTQHYTDGSTFNPHHCDALYEKYNNKKNEAETLRIAWENAYKNQASFSELYERAGKNMELAKKMMEEERVAIEGAQKAYEKALSEANAIYDDEILPCRKEM